VQVQIQVVDIEDEASFSAWFDIIQVSHVVEWPNEAGWLKPELLAIARNTTEFTSELGVAVDAEGRNLGALWIQFPLVENLSETYVFFLVVHPDHTGRGIGRSLLAHIEQRAKESGRSKLVGETHVSIEKADSARAVMFAEKGGFEPGLRSARRVFRFPIDGGAFDAIEASCAPHAAGYRLETWTGACPAEFRSGRCALAESIATDAPQGDLDKDPEVWDDDRLATFESMVRDMDRVSYCAGAVLESTGELVAFNEVTVGRSAPADSWQFDTIVLPEHRGHRLGTLVKIVNLRVIAAASPATARIFTWNAIENGPMIGINEALGFELASIGTVWQKSLA
jgi:GNAT superfamily N-acetyltransferase